MLENPNPKIFKTIDSQAKYDEIKKLKDSESTGASEEGFDALESNEIFLSFIAYSHYFLFQLSFRDDTPYYRP